MTEDQILNIKNKMKDYVDLFGGKLKDVDRVDSAKNIIELENIINDHYDYITDMATDAQNSLSRFKTKIGLI